MGIAEEDIERYYVDGVPCSFLGDEDMYRYFHGGVPIEQIARARGCSVSHAMSLLKRQKQRYEIQAYYQGLEQQEKFDKTLAKLDPAGNSAMTMAYLQPLRGFLQAVAHDK